MAIGTIGGFNVDIIRGLPQFLRPRVESWTVPGLDGEGAQTLGKGDAEFDLQTVNYPTNLAAADTFIAAAVSLQGTIVSVVDNYGNTFPNVLVKHVAADGPGVKRPMIWKGSNSARVELNWRMMTVA